MPEIYILLPSGDFDKTEEFPFSVKYKDAYLYRLDRQCWYKWVNFGGPDWLPINDCDVPVNYISRLKLIQLLL